MSNGLQRSALRDGLAAARARLPHRPGQSAGSRQDAGPSQSAGPRQGQRLAAPGHPDGKVTSVMSDFDHWGREVLAGGDLDALLDFEHKAPAARQAHPRTEHFAPLFVTLGASDGELTGARTVIDGFWYGLAKRSIEVS